MNALAVLTGRAPGALHAELAAAGDAAVALPAAPPELVLAIPAEVLRQRPDVQAAEQQLRGRRRARRAGRCRAACPACSSAARSA